MRAVFFAFPLNDLAYSEGIIILSLSYYFSTLALAELAICYRSGYSVFELLFDLPVPYM
jgi:hypothetical protein